MMTLFTAAANKIKCQTSSHTVTHFDEMHATNDDILERASPLRSSQQKSAGSSFSRGWMPPELTTEREQERGIEVKQNKRKSDTERERSDCKKRDGRREQDDQNTQKLSPPGPL